MPIAISSSTIASIHQLFLIDHVPEDQIAAMLGIAPRTVQRYLRKEVRRKLWRRHEALNPLYDPWRDGVQPMSLTAMLQGDPQPGRRELVANAKRYAGAT